MITDLYVGRFYPFYRHEDGRGRESDEKLIFVSTPETAHEDFCRYVIRMFNANNEFMSQKWLGVGCIKVERFTANKIDAKGYLEYNDEDFFVMFSGMEWKCDTGLYRPSAPGDELTKLLEQVGALK
jgi:hypothetical protein